MKRLFSLIAVTALATSVGTAWAAHDQEQKGQTGQQGVRSAAEWAPPIEIVQQGNDLVVRADLPGLKPDDVQIEIEDHVLTISGERRERQEDRRDGFYRSERSYGSFCRQIPLPKGVKAETAAATFQNGVLEVTIPAPKTEPSTRKLEIKEPAETKTAKAAA